MKIGQQTRKYHCELLARGSDLERHHQMLQWNGEKATNSLELELRLAQCYFSPVKETCKLQMSDGTWIQPLLSSGSLAA